ncbi:MAG: hypothetical protein LBC20_00495 [Planctomycetaceae bacterium]|jgi:hypothetical protein|nr:hypothetical protein [Planctomycetaceae bacterium]
MKENHYGFGPWEYRHVCKGCGHAVKPPKNKTPCSRCGGDFGPKTSMRKFYLEPEKPFEIVDVEYIAEPTSWESVKMFFGFYVEPRIEIRKEKKRGQRRWRWQTHTEVEEESGIIRHEEFFDDEGSNG